MFQALLICFREGLEAFLIVAIAALFLRRAHNHALLGALRWGVMTALAACMVLGVVLARVGEMSSAWAGVMPSVARRESIGSVTVATATPKRPSGSCCRRCA